MDEDEEGGGVAGAVTVTVDAALLIAVSNMTTET